MANSPRKAKVGSQTTLTLKLSHEQRDRLRKVVESRARELQSLTGQDLNITASDIVRWLIDREAEARGLLDSKATPSALAETLVPTTVPMTSTEHVPVSSTMPEVLRPLANLTPLPPKATIAAEPTLLSEPGDEITTSKKTPSAVQRTPEKLREKVEDALSRGAFKQRDLAEASGVSRSMVSRFVRGGRVAPETLRLISIGFGRLNKKKR